MNIFYLFKLFLDDGIQLFCIEIIKNRKAILDLPIFLKSKQTYVY